MNLDSQDVFTSNRDPDARINPKVVGSMWLNYSSGSVFLCSDNSLNANIWLRCGMTRAEIEALINNLVNAKLSSINSRIDSLSSSINSRIDSLSSQIRSGSGYFKSTVISNSAGIPISYVEIPAGGNYKVEVFNTGSGYVPGNEYEEIRNISTYGSGVYAGNSKVQVGIIYWYRNTGSGDHAAISTRAIDKVYITPV